VALLLTLALVALRTRVPRLLAVALLPVAGLFVLVQVSINTGIADLTRDLVPFNPALVGLSTDGGATEDQRCAALEAWLLPPWPEYYEQWVTEDLQEDYQRSFGTPFCARVDPTP
jgi:hypothetical protein